MIDISVIIPSYKPSSYFGDCISSIYTQTFAKEKIEVIVVVNGCDYSYISYALDILNQAKGLQFKLFYSMEPGVSNARNIALDYARGKYICFVDDDDIVSQTYLENMISLIENKSIVVSNVRAFVDRLENTKDDYIAYTYARLKKYGFSCNKFLVRRFFSSSCCKLIPRSVIGDSRFNVKFKNGEDALFMFLISDKIEKVIIADEHSIYYRRVRSDSLSRQKRNFKEDIKISFNLSLAFLSLFIRRFHKTNILFGINRVLAPYRRLFIIRYK
ncbi:glycosyltransferase family 2 protein [Oscillospiraceae bacterium N12]|jgi:glycosyltransferase involved in cell wall biosynthesis|uniref:Glycosyltransferase family 2 protein n=1 Tax=Jilunia laotingensis TaxID=2763675 RepID=A0A926IIK4_9BACT|nr:glycosyltransferase family 2 protein [Jilunia laotingensis]MBC8591852.1 glycosyltransferase family 2 protein [Jilunia laotingensis]